MGNLSVIDGFLSRFIQYVDRGFGLLGPDVGFLTSTLLAIDITLAGLFWSLGGEQDVMARFVRKILFVGAFAFIINGFSRLSDIIFRSFAQAGLTAGGGTLTAETLLKPGELASTGYRAAWPLLDQASKLTSFTTFFDNILVISVLMFAWAVVIVAFFILAVQMFVTIIEFKLTSLAGFILVPFALWNRTGFLAERVLGNVVASGIKVMVLAVIVGIGAGYFGEFAAALAGREPDIADAMSLMLASLAMFGLGIFGPGIASGLVAGAPQLGAGAAAGTMVGVAGTALAGTAVVGGAARAAGSGALAAMRAGTAVGSAAGSAFQMGQAEGGGTMAGLAGVGRMASSAVRSRIAGIADLGAAARRGQDAAWAAAHPASAGAAPGGPAGEAPRWAQDLRREQSARHHRHAAIQTLREGDRGGASANPNLQEKED